MMIASRVVVEISHIAHHCAQVTPAIEGIVGAGEATWHERGFEPADLDESWYVIAATDGAETKATTAARDHDRGPALHFHLPIRYLVG